MDITLINGDCLEELSKIKKENVCIVSDPPYNMKYHYNQYKDDLPEEEYLEWLTSIFNNFPCAIIHYPEILYKLSYTMGCFPEKVVSWVYNTNTPRQHRDIAFFRVVPDFSKVRQPYKNLTDKRIQKRLLDGREGSKLYDWWNINQIKNVSQEKSEHPCQIPVEVMRNIIGILPDDLIILDPFMGSGTTGVACKQLKRNFIGIEIDKKYFDIAEQRIGQVLL